MHAMRQTTGGSIEAHAACSAASRPDDAARDVSARSLCKVRSIEATEHPDAITMRRARGALQPFAVTPTLYFHANTNAAVALTVGVESVAIDPQAVAANGLAVF